MASQFRFMHHRGRAAQRHIRHEYESNAGCYVISGYRSAGPHDPLLGNG
jgi:hypothetical protein